MIHAALQEFMTLPVRSRILLASASLLLIDVFLTWEEYCYDPSDCYSAAKGREGVTGILLVLATGALVVREATPLLGARVTQRLVWEATPILGAELVERAPRLLAQLRLGLLVPSLAAVKIALALRHQDSVLTEDALTAKGWLGLALAGAIVCSAAPLAVRGSQERRSASAK